MPRAASQNDSSAVLPPTKLRRARWFDATDNRGSDLFLPGQPAGASRISVSQLEILKDYDEGDADPGGA